MRRRPFWTRPNSSLGGCGWLLAATLICLLLAGCQATSSDPTASPAAAATAVPVLQREMTATVTRTRHAEPTLAPTLTAAAAFAIPENAPVVVAGDSVVRQIGIGETFILLGDRGPQWQVGFDTDFLTLLTPPDLQQEPGDSWLFQARQATGKTRIWLNEVVPPCENEPCPPAGASIQLEVFIEIVAR